MLSDKIIFDYVNILRFYMVDMRISNISILYVPPTDFTNSKNECGRKKKKLCKEKETNCTERISDSLISIHVCFISFDHIKIMIIENFSKCSKLCVVPFVFAKNSVD